VGLCVLLTPLQERIAGITSGLPEAHVCLQPDCNPTGWGRPGLNGMRFVHNRQRPLWRLTSRCSAGFVGRAGTG
jgi:hypothetical protein